MATKSVQPRRDVLELAAGIVQSIPEATDGEEFADQQTARILTATEEADVLRERSTDNFGDLDGKTIIVHDLRRKMGGKNKRRGYFLLCDVQVDGEDDHAVYSTGSDRVCDQLLWAWSHDKLPWKVKVRVTKNDEGNEFHQLIAHDAF